MEIHESHAAIVVRLKRAKGHLEKVIHMIESEKECLEVAQQLQAVSMALEGAKRTYVHDHIDHCFERDLRTTRKNARSPVAELKAICKYL